MNDEEMIDPKAEAPPGRFTDTLLYDFAKFLTTLSLLALGGVLSLTQAAEPGEFKPFNIGLVLGTISLGGILSLAALHMLVDAQTGGKPRSKWPRRYVKAAMALIAIGLGAFLRVWWQALV